jgi:hypothetical protein
MFNKVINRRKLKQTNLVSQHQENAKIFKHGALRDHLQM